MLVMPRESMHLMPVSQAAAPEASFSSSCTHCSAATSHTGLVSALQRERGPGASRSWFNPEESTQQKASLESYHLLLAKQLCPLCNLFGASLAAFSPQVAHARLQHDMHSSRGCLRELTWASRAQAAHWLAAAA